MALDINKVSMDYFLRGVEAAQPQGAQTLAIPDKIDSETYDALIALKGGEARQAYLDSIRPRLSEASYNAAVSRLDDTIARAECLKAANKVVPSDQWAGVQETPRATGQLPRPQTRRHRKAHRRRHRHARPILLQPLHPRPRRLRKTLPPTPFTHLAPSTICWLTGGTAVFQRLEKVSAGGEREDFQPQRTKGTEERWRKGNGREPGKHWKRGHPARDETDGLREGRKRQTGQKGTRLRKGRGREKSGGGREKEGAVQ